MKQLPYVLLLLILCAGIISYTNAGRRADRLAVRIEYCTELEKLKTQNREDVFEAKKNYSRNLRLLGIKDTPELRRVAEEGWEKKLRRNAAKPCPYGG